MTAHIRKGGVWQEPVSVVIYTNGRWRRIARIKGYADGAWRDLANFTSPGSGGSSTPGTGGTGSSSPSITLTVSPSTSSTTGRNSTLTSRTLTATPNGGKAPYSYVWSIVTHSSGGSFAIDSPRAASTTVTVSGLALDGEANCTVRCTVTDSLGTVDASNTATCLYLRDSTFTGGTGGTGGTQSSL